jgi:hypothetical protein
MTNRHRADFATVYMVVIGFWVLFFYGLLFVR